MALDLGKHSREGWLEVVRWLCAQACTVHVVEEACGFGWQFHRDLLALGVDAIVCAPQMLNGKRKTDKLDARALATLLFDFTVRGNQRALKKVRCPEVAAHRRRSEGRHRSQMVEARKRLETIGRAMMWDHDHHEVPEGWWGVRKWPKLKAELLQRGKEWLVGLLEPLRQCIIPLVERIKALDEIIEKHTEAMNLTAPAPKGLGGATRVRMAAEVQDWHRFNNRKQMGSYMGVCPSEHSSGGKQRFGSIDRMGNRRLRTLSVEAVWRLKKWNSGWRGFKLFPHVFGEGVKIGNGIKKKAVVACARLLIIDLWRIETGRMKLEDVGLVAA